MKKCFKCGVLKELKEFYKHPQTKDGRLNKCKECNKKDVRENRAAKIDYYIEYDKNRANLPHRVKARNDYQKTDSGRAVGNRAKTKWTKNNLIKRSAALIVGNAIRHGEIIKSEVCQGCNNKHHRIHGHHDDYAYPMIVRWLCPKCHNKWHKENGPGLNGQSDLLNNQQQSSCQL